MRKRWLKVLLICFMSAFLLQTTFLYAETKVPETQKEREVKTEEVILELTAGWNKEASAYDRILTIYNWICSNVEYDLSMMQVEGTKINELYYAAVEKKAVCSGYALLFERLAEEMGIDAMVVTGMTSKDGSYTGHAWNLVKLGDYYYMVDPTWDAGTGGFYAYFLKPELRYHYLDNDFMTDEFLLRYPMAEAAYSIRHTCTYRTETKEADCTQGESEIIICRLCGEYTEHIGEPLGHDLKKYEAKKASCDVAGNIEYYQCRWCGGSYLDSEGLNRCDNNEWVIAAEGHKYGGYVSVSIPTCNTTGLDERVCEECGKREEKVVPMTEHCISVLAGKSASCTEDGFTEKIVCMDCGKVLQKAEVIASAGHKFSGWQVKKKPTVSECGLRVRLCSVCGKEEKQEISTITKEEGIEGFIKRLYRVILNRESDAEGLKFWKERLEAGMYSGAEMVQNFLNSQEYLKKKLSDVDYVEILYQTILGRNSDAGGKDFWCRRLANGVTRTGVLAGFVESQEFVRICKDYGIEAGKINRTAATDQKPEVTAFAARMYQVVLGRKFDRGGLEDWTGKLIRREIGGGELAKGFFFSKEFLEKKLSDEEIIRICYRTFLNREPEDTGFAHWMGKMEKGFTLQELLDGFIFSEEYGKICDRYGIER